METISYYVIDSVACLYNQRCVLFFLFVFFLSGADSIFRVAEIFSSGAESRPKECDKFYNRHEGSEYLTITKERLVLASAHYPPHENFFHLTILFSPGAETYYLEFHQGHI